VSQLGRGAGVVREAGDHEYGGLAAFPPTTVGRLFGAIGDVVLEAVTVLHGADIGAENPGVVGERSAPPRQPQCSTLRRLAAGHYRAGSQPLWAASEAPLGAPTEATDEGLSLDGCISRAVVREPAPPP